MLTALFAILLAALPAGLWGGDHIRLEVTAEGAAVELDCAHGTLGEPLRPDRDGRFTAAGKLVGEHAGPERRDELEHARPVRWVGQVTGDSMTLTVEPAAADDHGPVPGPFELQRGREPRLTKCR